MNVKQYILALDQGTTSSRALLIDHEANIKGIAQKEFRQIFPSQGWVEHDPQEIWASQAAVAAEVLARTGVSSEEIVAIGIANQRETTILWERKSGMPLSNAIVWQDRRTTDLCQKLKNEGYEPLFQKKTGLILDPYFSGTKIRWLLDKIPGAALRAERGELAFGTVDTWLLWKLTEGKVHITDATNASRTLLYNIHTGEWDDELLQILNIPRALLPKVRPSSEVYAEAARLFTRPIPISGMAGDQQAALFGQACFNKGMVKTTYGTGCFMLMNTGAQPMFSKNKLLTTIAYQLQDKVEYALEGSVFIGGAVVQWLRDNLKIIKKSSDIEMLSSKAQDNNGVYFVPAFTGLGAPYWNPYARGTILGLTRGTTDAHIARAALESIAFQVMDILEAMGRDSGIKIEELRVDGGAIVNDRLMQFQSDLLGCPIARPSTTELTGLGAAYLAGLAVGFWKNEEDIAAHWQRERTFFPSMPKDQAQYLRSKWKQAVACAEKWEGTA